MSDHEIYTVGQRVVHSWCGADQQRGTIVEVRDDGPPALHCWMVLWDVTVALNIKQPCLQTSGSFFPLSPLDLLVEALEVSS